MDKKLFSINPKSSLSKTIEIDIMKKFKPIFKKISNKNKISTLEIADMIKQLIDEYKSPNKIIIPKKNIHTLSLSTKKYINDFAKNTSYQNQQIIINNKIKKKIILDRILSLLSTKTTLIIMIIFFIYKLDYINSFIDILYSIKLNYISLNIPYDLYIKKNISLEKKNI